MGASLEKHCAKNTRARGDRQLKHDECMVKAAKYMHIYDQSGTGTLSREEVRKLASDLLTQYTPLVGGLTDDDVDFIMRCGGDTCLPEICVADLPQALAVVVTVREHNKCFHELFQKFDTDSTGKLPEDQLKGLLTEFSHGLIPTTTDLDFILHQCEPRGEKEPIEEAQLKAALACWYVLKPPASEQIKDLFKKWDTAGDGVITKKELGVVISKLSANLSEGELDIVFDSIDANHNGVIDYNEFVDWALSGRFPNDALNVDKAPHDKVKFSTGWLRPKHGHHAHAHADKAKT